MAERMAIGRAELCGEIDVAAELQHAVVVALEDCLCLSLREREFLEVLGFVSLERLAVLVLHQRHAEHVDAVALARTFGIEDEGAGNVVVVVLCSGHRRSPLPATTLARTTEARVSCTDIASTNCQCNAMNLAVS